MHNAYIFLHLSVTSVRTGGHRKPLAKKKKTFLLFITGLRRYIRLSLIQQAMALAIAFSTALEKGGGAKLDRKLGCGLVTANELDSRVAVVHGYFSNEAILFKAARQLTSFSG